jgi:O-antigen ligase
MALLAAIVVGLAVLPTDLGERALATIQGTQAPSGLEQSNRAHTALFWAGLRMINDAPITGVGPLNFKALSAQYSGLAKSYIAHNTYLEIAAELGLPLLAVFLALLVTTFGALARTARAADSSELAGWADGLRYGLIGFVVAGTFISVQYEKLFWIVVFLSIAMESVARRPVPASPAADDAAALSWRHATEPP